jgi:hypothetical protein
MPQANITYDVPYNKKLVSILDEMDEKHWKKAYPAYHPNPLGYRLGAFHGEMVGGGSSPMKYNPSGNSPAYPPHNLSSGLAVHSGGARYAGLDGAVGGMRHPADRSVGGDWIDDAGRFISAISPLAPLALGLGRKKRASKKGGLSFGDIGNALSKAADKALPIVTPVLQKVGEEYVKKKLGLGRKKGGKGMPLGEMVESSVPLGAGASGGKRTNKRAEIVKKVMREKGMKMIEASKYVKANKLY